MEFMGSLETTRTVSLDRFNMSLDTQKKTAFLLLRSPRLEDSAVYFCALSHSVPRLHLACHRTCMESTALNRALA